MARADSQSVALFRTSPLPPRLLNLAFDGSCVELRRAGYAKSARIAKHLLAGQI